MNIREIVVHFRSGTETVPPTFFRKDVRQAIIDVVAGAYSFEEMTTEVASVLNYQTTFLGRGCEPYTGFTVVPA